MPSINKQKLAEILSNAYEAGYHGSLEFKQNYIEEQLLDIFKMPDSIEQQGWKIYKIAELKELPFGTSFEHVRLGKGVIVGENERNKGIRFTDGDYFFIKDSSPWDEPMRGD